MPIYVLGYLGEPKALPVLLSVLKHDRLSRQLTALAAIGAIGPDDKAVAELKEVARDPDSEPAAVAYALNALGRADDPALVAYLTDNPPAHADDSGVRSILSRRHCQSKLA